MQPLFLLRLTRLPPRPFQPTRHVLEWSVRFALPRVLRSSEPWEFAPPAKPKRKQESIADLFWGLGRGPREVDLDGDL